MAATERKIPGTFAPVPGGYSQQISANTALFIPDFSVSQSMGRRTSLCGGP